MDQRARTIQFLEENIGEKHRDVGFGSDFLDVTPKAQEKTKGQIGLHKTKKFYASKGYPQSKKATIL